MILPPAAVVAVGSALADGVAALAQGLDAPAWALPVLQPTPILLPRAAAAGSLVVAGTLLLLFVYRRRPYILFWIGAWLANALGQHLLAEGFTRPHSGHVLIGLAQFLGVASGLLLVLSADRYRQEPVLPRRLLLGLMPLLIWFGFTPWVFGLRAVLVPGHLLSAGVAAVAGVAYLNILRQGRLLGAGLVGTTLLLIAAASVWMAYELPELGLGTAAFPAHVIAVSALLHTLAALGMHLMVFEEMTYELRLINRRLALAQSDLRQLVITDPLTGCRNRRFFDEIISRELHRHRRYQTPLTLIFVDIDRFKAINDALGHEAGDRILQGVAGFLRQHVREADYLFRWGGDEFLILMSCRQEEAVRKARALKAAFAASPLRHGLPPGVGLSVGCAEVAPGASDAADSLRLADQRMYEDKLAGPDPIAAR